MRPNDSGVLNDRFWVGDFELLFAEVGSRAGHWEVEENDGMGSLLDGIAGLSDDGWPTFDEPWLKTIEAVVPCEHCEGRGFHIVADAFTPPDSDIYRIQRYEIAKPSPHKETPNE